MLRQGRIQHIHTNRTHAGADSERGVHTDGKGRNTEEAS